MDPRLIGISQLIEQHLIWPLHERCMSMMVEHGLLPDLNTGSDVGPTERMIQRSMEAVRNIDSTWGIRRPGGNDLAATGSGVSMLLLAIEAGKRARAEQVMGLRGLRARRVGIYMTVPGRPDDAMRRALGEDIPGFTLVSEGDGVIYITPRRWKQIGWWEDVRWQRRQDLRAYKRRAEPGGRC